MNELVGGEENSKEPWRVGGCLGVRGGRVEGEIGEEEEQITVFVAQLAEAPPAAFTGWFY